MNSVTRNRKKPKPPFGDDRHQLNRKCPQNPPINRKTSLILPLVLCTFFGKPVLGSAEGIGSGLGDRPDIEQLVVLRQKAAGGNPDAMYWLAMLHIEGKIAGADYDKGTELLRQAADRGHTDAGRMWSFMDNAFSGDGC